MLSSKDGRKINNGDCALFQAGETPPFIAKINYQIVVKDGDVRLGVNWLYRPGDVKLPKTGEDEEEKVPLPPNEVFYSFYKEEISGSSLLHPCKVAFLGKSVELPSGVSSFVCRRVYDITSKCLWWLTDKDFINEHQEEVDELLNKTRKEMQAIMHSRGPSPRIVNISAQIKAGSDTIQNGSLAKVRKKQHVEQNHDSLKRGCFSRSINSDSKRLKQDCNMRLAEIINITEKDGSLVNSVGVEHLVHLMQQDRKENMKKGRDLVLHRTMLVRMIATTDQEDCLRQFVHSGGLSILDEWLQKAHKGKSGDGGSPKEGEKAHEDLLLVLLQALGRLPVDLEALKTCHVGKSVNHLRNHKNMDIHKKAKCLVDKWKRHVDEEMKTNAIKFGSSQDISLSCKHGPGDVVLKQGIKGAESDEITSKGLVSFAPSLKVVSSRLAQGDVGKGTSVSPHPVKVLVTPSPANSLKNPHYIMPDSGTTDLLIKTTEEDKRSNSNQLENYRQSCPSSHAIASGSVWKEDAQSSAVGSIGGKVSNFASLHEMPRKGFIGFVQSGNNKVSLAKPLLLSTNTADEKDTHAVFEKEIDNTLEDGSQRLIVRLTNLLCTPAQCLNHGSNADKITPVNQGPPLDKKGRHEGKGLTQINFHLNNHASEVNDGSLQSNRTRLLSANNSEDNSCNSEHGIEFLKMTKSSQSLSSGPGEKEEQKEKAVKAKKLNLHEATGIADGVEDSSVLSKATLVSIDKCGMNLLASVVPTEISKFEDSDVADLGTKLMTGDDYFWQHTKSDCHSKTISAEFDDAVCQNSLDLKKDNNHFDSMDECQKVEFISQEHGSLNSSNGALDPEIVTEVGEGENEFTNDTIQEISVKCMSWEHENATSEMENCMLSIEGVEQSRELLCPVVEKLNMNRGGLGLVCAEQGTRVETEEHNMHKSGEFDNLGRTKLNTMDDTSGLKVEQSKEQDTEENKLFEEDKEEDENGKLGMVSEGYDACSRVSSCDVSELKVDKSGSAEDSSFQSRCHDPKEAGKEADYEEKSICTKPSNKYCHDIISFNKQPKIIAILDVKEQYCSRVGGNKDKEKEDADDQHLNVTRNHTRLDEIQETMTIKRKYNEVEQTLESAENHTVHQESNESGIVHKKNNTREAGCETAVDVCYDKMKEDCKLSSVHSPIYQTDQLNKSNVSSKCVTRQEGHVLTLVTKSTCSSELASSKRAMATEVPAAKNNGNNLKDNGISDTAERPDFDLNKSIDLDGAAQYEWLSNTNSCGCCNKRTFYPSHQFSMQQRRIRNRAPLDIDLNVADEGTLKEEGTPTLSYSEQCLPMRSSQHRDITGQVFVAMNTNESPTSNGLSCSLIKPDSDLNCTGESLENGMIKMTLEKIPESFPSTSKLVTNGLPHSVSCVLRNFDLNDGPSLEDTEDQLMAHNSIGKGTSSSCPTSTFGMRMSGEGLNLSSLSPRNGVQALAMASYPSARAEHRAVAAAVSHSNFNSLDGPNFFGGGDIYGEKIPLSSYPSVSFSNTTAPAYSFAGFPFGSNFPLTSASFSERSSSYPNLVGLGCSPAISPQIVTKGPPSSSYVRPYMMNTVGVSGAESSGAWLKQNLDLNTGPGTGGTDLREDNVFGRQTSSNGPVPLEQVGTLCQLSAPGASSEREESGEWGFVYCYPCISLP
ncbi:hypothetical protein SUGI_0658130 [Cryptomeria japonica]|nr:hypothetical protein SUGI_0658130 [Cryptomeria japonica]